MPTFYIGFYYYQLNQYVSYYSVKLCFLKVLLNLNIVLKKKLALSQPLLVNQLGRAASGREGGGGLPCRF